VPLSAPAILISVSSSVSEPPFPLEMPLLIFVGGECYCGDTIEPSGTLADIGGCNDLCDGNQNEYCGGANRLDLYFLSGNATFTTTSSSSSTRSTASSASASTTATGPVHVPTAGSYQWVGCYTDQIGNRALTALTETNHQTMTVEICASFCSAYVLFGVEYSMFPLFSSGP
jgi:hypothetical protein